MLWLQKTSCDSAICNISFPREVYCFHRNKTPFPYHVPNCRAIGNALIGDVNVVNGVFTNALSQIKIVNTTTGQPSVNIQPLGTKSSLRSSTANTSSNITHNSVDYATKLRQSLRAKAAAIADYEYEAGYIESFYNGDYDEQ